MPIAIEIQKYRNNRSSISPKVDEEAKRRVTKQRLAEWCKSKAANPIPYYETSAKESIQVEAAFRHVAQLALKQDTNGG